ncbi:MAG: lipopolysaccharide heptosyltransferase II [Flavobacteriales bacterium]|nr:lipopolysaccharide heptosyltransferase II [Flavobacteriales bacterium]
MTDLNQKNAIQKVLVRLPNWLGDLVMSLSFIEALKLQYPEAEIHVIVKDSLSKVLEKIGGISKIFEFSKTEYPGLMGNYKFGKKVRGNDSYDVFFCLPNSFSSAFMGYFTRSKSRVGYKNELRGTLLTHAFQKLRPGQHRVEEYLNLLTNFTQKTIKSPLPRLTSETNNHRLVPDGKNLLLNITSEAESRKMPLELAGSIGSAISEKHGYRIVLTGLKKDKDQIQELVQKFKPNVDFIDLCGKTTLEDLIHILRTVNAVITTDSGIAHLSNALATKTIVLFGAGDDSNTRPYNPQNLKIIRKKGVSCAPCVSNTCRFGHLDCMKINSEEVVEAFEALIA